MKQLLLIVFLFISVLSKAQEIKWYTFEEAVELNKTEPRLFMVDVYTDWCGYCKIMDKNTFQNPIIADYLNKNYYAVKLNAEQKEDLLFKGRTYKFIAQGRRGVHEWAAMLLNNQLSYPSIVFLNEDIQKLNVQKGYIKAPQFDLIIKYFGGKHHLKTPYEEWIKTYESPFVSN